MLLLGYLIDDDEAVCLLLGLNSHFVVEANLTHGGPSSRFAERTEAEEGWCLYRASFAVLPKDELDALSLRGHRSLECL